MIKVRTPWEETQIALDSGVPALKTLLKKYAPRLAVEEVTRIVTVNTSVAGVITNIDAFTAVNGGYPLEFSL